MEIGNAGIESKYVQDVDTSESILQRFAGAVPWGAVSTGWSVIASLLISVIIVRGLGSEKYGTFALLATTMGYVTLLSGLGLPNAIHRFVPELTVKGSWHGIVRLIQQTVVITALLGLFVLAVVGAFGSRLDNLFSTNLSNLLILGTAVYVVGIVTNILVGAIYASYQVKFLTILRLVASPILLLLTYAALQAGSGLPALIVIGALPMGTDWAAVIAVLVLPILVWKFIRIGKGVIKASQEVIPISRVLRYSTVFVVSGLINLVVQRQSEVFFIAHYMTPRDVAFYSLGYSFSQRIMEFMPSVIWLLGLFSFTEVLYRNPDKFDVAVKTLYKFVFLIGVPISLVGFLTADKIINLVYGQEMAMAGELSRYFFLIFAIPQIIFPIGIASYTLEKAWYEIPGAASVAIADIGLSSILIPRFGLAGAIWAVVLTNLLALPIILIVVRVFVFRRPLPIPIIYLLRCWLLGGFLLPLLLLRSYMGSPIGLIGSLIAATALVVLGIRIIGLVGEEEEGIIRNSKLPLNRLAIAVLSARRART